VKTSEKVAFSARLFQINLALNTAITQFFQNKLRTIFIILPVLTSENANQIA